ncbi:MAG: hypothetical protein R3268_13230 [Acidiferrobacterales bacterium]|nr:hypothetical protein [Acidiferrobacterales bacterium]
MTPFIGSYGTGVKMTGDGFARLAHALCYPPKGVSREMSKAAGETVASIPAGTKRGYFGEPSAG